LEESDPRVESGALGGVVGIVESNVALGQGDAVVSARREAVGQSGTLLHIQQANLNLIAPPLPGAIGQQRAIWGYVEQVNTEPQFLAVSVGVDQYLGIPLQSVKHAN
jgi:hypothetical protein